MRAGFTLSRVLKWNRFPSVLLVRFEIYDYFIADAFGGFAMPGLLTEASRLTSDRNTLHLY
jgi:hypothetical protein